MTYFFLSIQRKWFCENLNSLFCSPCYMVWPLEIKNAMVASIFIMKVICAFMFLNLIHCFGEACEYEDVEGRFPITSLTKVAGTMKSCKWAGQSQTRTRCKLPEVLKACPVTCGQCETEPPLLSDEDIAALLCSDSPKSFWVSKLERNRKCKLNCWTNE